MGMNRKAVPAPGVAKPVARVSESRKVRKPLMEKKRRARINQSLNDLKRLLLESNSVKKEGSRPTKLEKADILELTVSHVQKLHHNWGVGAGGTPTTPPPADDACHKFKAGFSECARLVRQLLDNRPQMAEPGLGQRLAEHLQSCLNNLEDAYPNHILDHHANHTDDSSRQSSPCGTSRSNSRSSFNDGTPSPIHDSDRKSPPATPSFIYNPVAKITPTTAMNHEKGHHSNHWTSTNAFNTSPAPPPVTPATTPYHHGNGRHSNPHVTCSTDEEDEDEGAWSEQRSPPLDLTADKWRRSAPHDFWAAHPGRAGRGLWAGLTCLKMAANEEANHALWRPW